MPIKPVKKKTSWYKRRLIVSRFQYWLLAGDFLYLLAMLLVIVTASLVPLLLTLDDTSLPAGQRDDVARGLMVIGGRIWLAIPIIVALCALHSLIVSHRIAGPLNRFTKIFRNLGQGDLSANVRVRRTDYLRQEADFMNEMIDGMASRVRAIRDDHAEASATLARLVQHLGRSSDPETAVAAGKLGAQLDQLGRGIRAFHIRSDAGETATIETSDENDLESATAGAGSGLSSREA